MDLANESLTDLNERIRAILPEMYQESYEDVQPVSMGSAALKYDDAGKVAWGEIWESFCDLAMAGGPPHKGRLLRPASQNEVDHNPERYQQVVDEICRGIFLAADLNASRSDYPGWVQVQCESAAMAEWLVRAVTMENVATHWEGEMLLLPASPSYRIEKEVKNVVTVIAKTCHYWVDHMWSSQQRTIANLFAGMAQDNPLLGPSFPFSESGADQEGAEALAQKLHQHTGLLPVSDNYGWLGLQCDDIQSAIWMMRALVASNILARREGSTLFVPVNEIADPASRRLLRIFSHISKLSKPTLQPVQPQESHRTSSSDKR